MSTVAQEPQIKAGMRCPVLEGTRIHFSCNLDNVFLLALVSSPDAVWREVLMCHSFTLLLQLYFSQVVKRKRKKRNIWLSTWIYRVLGSTLSPCQCKREPSRGVWKEKHTLCALFSTETSSKSMSEARVLHQRWNTVTHFTASQWCESTMGNVKPSSSSWTHIVTIIFVLFLWNTWPH